MAGRNPVAPRVLTCAKFASVDGRRYISAAALVVIVILILVLATPRRETGPLTESKWPRNVAHRGASAVAPENTLEAFQQARKAGAGGLETDVHLSRDGRVVVLHDSTLDRTTNGSGAVLDKTLQELRSLDAGYLFTPGGVPDEGVVPGAADHPYRGRGVRIPTLREVLEEFPEMTVNLDIKEATPGIEEAVLTEIDRASARERVLVASKEGAVISRFRRLSGGEVATAASRWEIARFYALSLLRLEELADPPYEALQVPVEHRGIELATGRFVEAAHYRGVRVDVWTIDELEEMSRLLTLGADSIMTNRPGELRRVLESREGGMNGGG
jgi:glycerophosphoryl diester phosphodiesterase